MFAVSCPPLHSSEIHVEPSLIPWLYFSQFPFPWSENIKFKIVEVNSQCLNNFHYGILLQLFYFRTGKTNFIAGMYKLKDVQGTPESEISGSPMRTRTGRTSKEKLSSPVLYHLPSLPSLSWYLVEGKIQAMQLTLNLSIKYALLNAFEHARFHPQGQ